MVVLDIKIEVKDGGLSQKVEAMAKYLDAHDPAIPCTFVDLAAQIGEIDLDASVDMDFSFVDGVATVELIPKGDLARLLDAFDGVAS